MHYFDTFGRAEPIRMALWKVGCDYNDNRVSGEAWQALKDSGKLPFGTIPALELADGTVIAQATTIFHYLTDIYP